MLELGRGKGREQHGCRFVDPLLQERGVEMVAVQVRHVEVVRSLESAGIEPVIAGEHEPRAVKGRHEPRVAEHAAARGLDEQPGVTGGRDAHGGRL